MQRLTGTDVRKVTSRLEKGREVEDIVKETGLSLERVLLISHDLHKNQDVSNYFTDCLERGVDPQDILSVFSRVVHEGKTRSSELDSPVSNGTPLTTLNPPEIEGEYSRGQSPDLSEDLEETDPRDYLRSDRKSSREHVRSEPSRIASYGHISANAEKLRALKILFSENNYRVMCTLLGEKEVEPQELKDAATTGLFKVATKLDNLIRAYFVELTGPLSNLKEDLEAYAISAREVLDSELAIAKRRSAKK